MIQRPHSAFVSDLLGHGVDLTVRLVVEVALALQLVAAAFYWWLSPKGFPVGHSRFWINSVLPVAVMAVAAVGLAGMLQHRRRLAAVAVLCFSSGWAAGAMAGRGFFPSSLGRIWLFGLLVAIVGTVCFALLLRGVRKQTYLWISCSVLSGLVAVGVVWSQIPPRPTTQPIDEPPPTAGTITEHSDFSASVFLARDRVFLPAIAELVMKQRGVTVRCSPLLEFDRISPDGFWSLFAPPPLASERRIVSDSGPTADSRTFFYSDGSAIVVPATTIPEAVDLVCYTPLDVDTFSHLNSYSVVEISGHQRLFLSFSPCQDAMIEVLPADYPTGRPARFAYLDRLDTFHIVEASSGEKGPFHSLATGQLRRGEPLAISLYDEGTLIASVVLEDWSEQVSTTLSPTAGWSVPMNAIEFQRSEDRPDSSVTMWITLAATSVGRGWDSVGHRAGIYRNRISFRFETL